MSVFEDGFFDLNLDDDTPAMKAIDISMLSIALLIQLVIGITAIFKISGNRNINKTSIILFVTSWCFACTFSIGGLLDHFGGGQIRKMIQFVTVISFGFFFQSLLWTLVIRLYITFKESDYPLTSGLIAAFSVIILFEFVGWTVFCTLSLLMREKPEYVARSDYFRYFVSLGFSLLISYISGSALAVYSFVERLTKLAEDREKTVIDLSLSAGHIELDRAQQNLSKLSAKYLLLFAVAITSTILMQILSYFVNIGSGLRAPILAIDLCINLLMLYLQFGIERDTYQRCCGCCDTKCSSFMSLKTKRALHRQSIAMSLSPSAEIVAATLSSGGDVQGGQHNEEYLRSHSELFTAH